MSKQLIVPARLEKAAKELVNNVIMLKACSPEMKEVIKIAEEKGLLRLYTNNGDKCNWKAEGVSLGCVYCLPDDIEIVVEPVEPVVPEWVSKKYTVCEVEPFLSECFKMKRPDGTVSEVFGLPAVIHCKGWIFKGWLHEGYNYIDNCPLMFNTGRDFWRSLSESRDLDGHESSIAYASVWQKAESK